MMIYLVKMTDQETGKVVYKTGHTKWGPDNYMKRFDYPEYATFNVELLSYAMLSHPNWNVAKAAIIAIENMTRVIIPPKDPSFMIEDYFERPSGTMKIGGVTELIFLKDSQSEDDLVYMFSKFVKAITKTGKELKEKIRG